MKTMVKKMQKCQELAELSLSNPRLDNSELKINKSESATKRKNKSKNRGKAAADESAEFSLLEELTREDSHSGAETVSVERMSLDSKAKQEWQDCNDGKLNNIKCNGK